MPHSAEPVSARMDGIFQRLKRRTFLNKSTVFYKKVDDLTECGSHAFPTPFTSWLSRKRSNSHVAGFAIDHRDIKTGMVACLRMACVVVSSPAKTAIGA
jgi:hypothetical protein